MFREKRLGRIGNGGESNTDRRLADGRTGPSKWFQNPLPDESASALIECLVPATGVGNGGGVSPKVARGTGGGELATGRVTGTPSRILFRRSHIARGPVSGCVAPSLPRAMTLGQFFPPHLQSHDFGDRRATSASQQLRAVTLRRARADAQRVRKLSGRTQTRHDQLQRLALPRPQFAKTAIPGVATPRVRPKGGGRAPSRT